MKRLAFLLFLCFIITGLGCSHPDNQQDSSKKEKDTYPIIEFERDFYNFGSLNQGEKVSHSFGFQNKGNKDLLIRDAVSACGCTVAQYPKNPVAPGKKGKVKITFDTAHRRGLQYKTVTLYTNSKNSKKTLYIKANVVVNNKN